MLIQTCPTKTAQSVIIYCNDTNYNLLLQQVYVPLPIYFTEEETLRPRRDEFTSTKGCHFSSCSDRQNSHYFTCQQACWNLFIFYVNQR